MLRKVMVVSLFSLFLFAPTFSSSDDSYRIYIENRRTEISVELSASDKEILKNCINELDFEKGTLRKTPIRYIIILEIGNERIYYKVSGVYIAKADNDLYMCCEEIYNVIKKLGI